MKSGLRLVGLICVIVVIGACNPVRVFLEKEQLPNAASYKTFAIENQFPGKHVYGSADLDKNLQELLIEGMVKRGFVLDIEDPDLVLRYNSILSQNQKEVNTMGNNRWGMYDPFMWRYPYPYDYGRGGYKVEKYNLGEVVIDFVDQKRQEAVLRISAVGEVTKPKQLNKNVNASVDRILTEFSKKITSL